MNCFALLNRQQNGTAQTLILLPSVFVPRLIVSETPDATYPAERYEVNGLQGQLLRWRSNVHREHRNRLQVGETSSFTSLQGGCRTPRRRDHLCSDISLWS